MTSALIAALVAQLVLGGVIIWQDIGARQRMREERRRMEEDFARVMDALKAEAEQHAEAARRMVEAGRGG